MRQRVVKFVDEGFSQMCLATSQQFLVIIITFVDAHRWTHERLRERQSHTNKDKETETNWAFDAQPLRLYQGEETERDRERLVMTQDGGDLVVHV